MFADMQTLNSKTLTRMTRHTKFITKKTKINKDDKIYHKINETVHKHQ